MIATWARAALAWMAERSPVVRTLPVASSAGALKGARKAEAEAGPRIVEAERRMIRSNEARTDRYFAGLMVLQWLGLIAVAIWVTPRTWIGATSATSPFVAVALVCGGIISLVPAASARLWPGERWTRHGIAIGQMLMSTMLIHLAGGRLEMHFHIFGSLAFLAFYLDWTVILTASAVVLLDHTLSNFLWPQSIFGLGAAQPYRWLEHVGWVVFCDVFLIGSCFGRMRGLRLVARQNVQQETLLAQAYTDALTGLPNRLRLQREMEAAIALAEETGIGFEVMYVDLDKFKQVNDTQGHAMGDRVLLEVAARLREAGPEGSIFARIGGDEFVAVCPRTAGSTSAEDRAREILTSLLMPIDLEGQMIHIGASIGVSLYPEHGRSEEELLHHADTAMYSVKRKGRRGYSFYDAAMETTEPADAREAAEARLLRAIEEDEFSVHYQPLLNPEGHLQGLEALVRWSRMETEGEPVQVSPGEFIPLAESSGLIVRLGQQVLEKVCAQVAEWRQRAIKFGYVAVNLSPRQLVEADFLTMLDRTMAHYGVLPEWLAFEVTESACGVSEGAVEALLEALRERGIRASLDDFGTGYSSFGRLQGRAFDSLKIDRIFISRLGQSETGYGVVAGIINIAHLMGMTVVAEGVENAVQWELLREMNCDVLQGYHLSRPLAAPAAQEFILRLGQAGADAEVVVVAGVPGGPELPVPELPKPAAGLWKIDPGSVSPVLAGGSAKGSVDSADGAGVSSRP